MTFRQLIVMLVVVLLGAAAAVYHFRPELVSRENAEQLLEQLKEISLKKYLPGDNNETGGQQQPEHHQYTAKDIEKATQEVLQQRQREQVEDGGGASRVDLREKISSEVAPEGKKYLYQLEFTNGKGTIAEHVSFGKGTVRYESRGGVEVTVPESTVVSLQRIVIELPQEKEK